MSDESSVKQRLLELAIQTIDESGEPGIRVNQLAESAGVSIPTLYHHFGSREGLIEEAQVERFIRALRRDAEALIQQLGRCKTKTDLIETIHQLFKNRKAKGRALTRWQRLNALGATYARPTLAERIVSSHDEFVTNIALALLPFQRKGFIRQDIDLRAVVAWYNGALLGKNLVQISESAIDLAEWDRVFDEAVFAVLFGEFPA